MDMIRRALDWLEDRTGVESAVKGFLHQDVPDSSGWPQVFGSIALFAILTQAFTGILLSLNYAPVAGDAYDSLRYILTEVIGGRLVRGLHYWGASLMVIVVVLHMMQTFLWGAYKRPREATWMSGVILLLLTLAYGLSGYLLPWDNRGYWGTLAVTRIAALAPGVGEYLMRLLGSDGSTIGAITFARFYTAHVLLLPPLTILLAAVHVYLVRRHGLAPSPEDAQRPTKKFYPEQMTKDTVATFTWFVILFGMAIFARVPLGHQADPTDLAYTTRTEWYFLFFFEFLKRFEGPLEVLGAVVIPSLAVLALFLIPFVDRVRVVQVRRRFGAIAVTVLAVIGWGGLTVRALSTTPVTREMDMSLVQTWQEIPAADLASIGYFRDANCVSCHPLGESGAGTDLLETRTSRPAEWLIGHIRRPSDTAPEVKLSDVQMQVLASFLTRRGDKAVDAWQHAPQNAVDGAKIFIANDCAQCHQLNGVGDALGPPLNGIGERQSREWIQEYLGNPQKFSKDSIMPAYEFDPKDLNLITDYIRAIPR